jgi:hypothetical protein
MALLMCGLRGRSIIDSYGIELRISLMESLDSILNRDIPSKSKSSDQQLLDFDNRRSAAVVLLGSTGIFSPIIIK